MILTVTIVYRHMHDRQDFFASYRGIDYIADCSLLMTHIGVDGLSNMRNNIALHIFITLLSVSRLAYMLLHATSVTTEH